MALPTWRLSKFRFHNLWVEFGDILKELQMKITEWHIVKTMDRNKLVLGKDDDFDEEDFEIDDEEFEDEEDEYYPESMQYEAANQQL